MSDYFEDIQSDEDIMVSNIDEYELYLIENGEDIDQAEEGWVTADVDVDTLTEDDVPF